MEHKTFKNNDDINTHEINKNTGLPALPGPPLIPTLSRIHSLIHHRERC